MKNIAENLEKTYGVAVKNIWQNGGEQIDSHGRPVVLVIDYKSDSYKYIAPQNYNGNEHCLIAY
jgi:hypothetical protein